MHCSPLLFRRLVRAGSYTKYTSGICPGFIQCNVVILPEDWAEEFLQFCQLNPKYCPLLGVSANPGEVMMPELAEEFDIRTDVPEYQILEHGLLVKKVINIVDYWRDDLVTFLLGCSFSFEEELLRNGLEVRHITEKCNVPMYLSSIQSQTAGRFCGPSVVSMRPFLASDAISMIQICSNFPAVHGAPIHLGDHSLIGIKDLDRPDYGNKVTIKPDELPVFTACGVTAHVAIKQARVPFCITHSPGCMVVTDLQNDAYNVSYIT